MSVSPNLLVFAVDSLRADHCSAYGYHRLTTPYLDRLADRGTLFQNHYSPCIPTWPAFSTLLTGRDVMEHQVISMHQQTTLDPQLPTLPVVLREAAGYRSICVGLDLVGSPSFDRVVEYDQGWKLWRQRPARKAENLNSVAIPALEELARGDRPWMLFMRHMDPHAPYLPPAPYDKLFYGGDPTCQDLFDTMDPVRACPNFVNFHLSWMPPGIRDISYPTAMYDGAVAYMDSCIAAILNRLDELGQTEKTLVVVTSDHGETLDEHGCYFDHHGLYEPTLHVPLILSHPGHLPQGKTVSGMTLHQDIMPTLLDYVGLHDAAQKLTMEGRSLLPLISVERQINYAEFYLAECTWMRKRGWRTGEWKLIEALEPDYRSKPPIELYHLTADPEERINLAESEVERVRELQGRMNSWVTQRLSQTGKPDPILQYRLGADRRLGSVAEAQKLQSRIRQAISRQLSSLRASN